MNKLRTYLRSLPSDDDRVSFAVGCGTTAGHLRNISYDLRVPAAELCVAIEQDTGRAVMRWDLRPDDWHLIWPELIGQPGAPAVEQKEA